MADGKGLRRLVQLVVDKASARKVKRELSQAIEKGTDPAKAKRNIKVIGSALGGLKRLALGLGAALGAAFAIRGLIRFGKEAVRVAAEAEDIWSRLAQAVKNTGVAFADVEGDIKGAARALQDVTQIGDEDFATVLTELITTTGDYAASLKNVELVADLAAAKQIDLRAASQLVARAMVGQVSTLARYGIIVEEGADAIEVLRDRFAGFARNEATTFQGKLAQINNEWQDFLQAVGEGLTTAEGGISAMETLRATIEQLTIWVDRNRIGLNRWAASLITTAQNVGVFVGKILDAIDPMGKMARLEMEAIERLDTEEALLLKRIELSQRILSLGDEQEEQAARARLLSGHLKRAAEEREADLESEILTIQALIRHIDALIERRNQAGGGGGGGGEPGPRRRADPVHAGALEKRETLLFPGMDMLPFGLELEPLVEESTAAANTMETVFLNAAWNITDAFSKGFEAVVMDMSSLPKAAVGIGLGIVSGLAAGMAQYHTAQAVGKLAEGTWPPNPAAIAAALKHFAAAGLFSALQGLTSRGQDSLNRGGGGGFSGGAADTISRDQGGETVGPSINIFLDPFDPNSALHQRQVYRATTLAQERWGTQIPVNIVRGGGTG
jgi:hypothetical protein